MFTSAPDKPFLVIEAATTAGSVALVQGRDVFGEVAVTMGLGREDQLFPAICALLEEAGLTVSSLGGVVCGAGPGSFTSLRIAAALAKGLAHGANLPLFALSSLWLAAAALREPGQYVVHADALRLERYAQPITVTEDGVVSPDAAVLRLSAQDLVALSAARTRVAVLATSTPEIDKRVITPVAANLVYCDSAWSMVPVSLDRWEPDYGRLAEAQVKWESMHGVSLEW